MRPPDRNTRRTTILDTYIRGIAEHYATDPAYAPNIFELAHGPHVYAAIVEARQRAADEA
jgi:hypothetical protein